MKPACIGAGDCAGAAGVVGAVGRAAGVPPAGVVAAPAAARAIADLIAAGCC